MQIPSFDLSAEYDRQSFPNGYELIDGVAMHAENPEYFQIPPDVLKRNVAPGFFVEVRLDSERFSIHEGGEACECGVCKGEMTKPVLSHEQPNSLITLPDQQIPSRGWGEDFWVKVSDFQGNFLSGIIDNRLVETRLHELRLGDAIFFTLDHVLAIHPIHREQMVASMTEAEIRELVAWLETQRDEDS